MKIDRKRLKGIPTVMLYDGQLKHAVAKGCILCYHGLTSSKDAWLHDLEIVAEHGFLTVGVDSVGHGERRYPDFETRMSQDNPHFWHAFTKAVCETADEVPVLLDGLIQNSLATDGRIGMLGVSMGGFITYSAILVEPRITAAVTIVSSPEWWELKSPQSPHHHVEGFARIKLLSQTGGKDTVIPSRFTYAFHNRLKSHYSDYESRFEHHHYPASNHMMDPDWEACWQKSIAWFEHQLARRRPN